MINFLENWNYKKHAAAVTAFYAGTAILGNAFLDKKTPSTRCCRMTKKQRIFYGILGGMYSVDMSVTYLFLEHLKKQCKQKENI